MDRCLGIETREYGDGRVALEVYLDAAAPWFDAARLAARLGVELVGSETVEDRDWMAAYRQAARPFELGRNFEIDPSEPATADPLPPVAAASRRRLSLPARRAFGTGSHATTRLAVELLEDLAAVGAVAGRTALDLGCGTGILAFVALALGARGATALDVDPAAVFQARLNSARNHLWPRLVAAPVSALAPDRQFDLVLANVLPENLDALEEAEVARRLVPGGQLVLSGVLASRADEIAGRWRLRGLLPSRQREAEEWVAWVFEAPGRP